jgi:hypothetical protein
MKTLTILILAFLSQITGAQNLHADQMRIRYQNQNGTWTKWDTSECSVPIIISREMNIIQVKNKLDMTYSIQDKGPNYRYYESVDYEGRSLVIVLYENPDDTYNVMLQYNNIWDGKTGQLLACGYSYQYLHAKKVKK